MFPEAASFVCRKCYKAFYFEPADYESIVSARKIGCPGCGSRSSTPGDIGRFFKFYPRLVSASREIEKSGFGVTDIGFDVDEHRTFWLKDMEFKCKACGKTSRFSAGRVDNFAAEPGLFGCKKCRMHPKPLKPFKEFFVSFRWVYRAMLYSPEFQWDTVGP